MRTLASLMFAAILTPLGARLALPYLRNELPPFADPIVELLVWWTDLLAVPFAGFSLPGVIGGSGGPGFAFGRIEPDIVIALIGWSIIQAVVLGALALFRRRPSRATDRRAEDEA